MTDKVKLLSPKIWEKINSSSNILMTLHRGPDGDSLGSCLAFANLFHKIGKKFTLIQGDTSKLANSSKAFPGYELIKPVNIFQINLSDFDLFITLDTANIDQISKINQINFPKSMTIITIDHHGTNIGFGNINLIDETYPANCQLIADFFEANGIEITPNMAVCLYLGIFDDTFFKYPRTNYGTFEVAAKLTKINPDFSKAVAIWENSRDRKTLDFWTLAFTKIKSYFNGTVNISAISLKEIKEKGISEENISTSEIATIIRSIENTQIAITIIEKDDKTVSVSFRSYTKDVSKIAIYYGGGGHFGAAGATINMSFETSLGSIIAKVKDIYPELGEP